ncbi:uncharacterized protein LOC133020889 [Limanda limanda]|uniref:uncharacterized protein LOC133020889 n=1 Tax=Limanda limanda TaxID=27771 RepID=UPI0029C7AF00|nr:uncharacterized protein LOC133020889 [Limanda limanda]
MALHLSILLIITGLTGVHNTVTTISKVSVKAGGSITIPCRYGSMYRENVKYLCQGYTFFNCNYVVLTNKPHYSGKVLISDDKSQRIFTVTIKDLKNADEYFWCSVKIIGTDDGSRFQLSLTNGLPDLYVDHQDISGFIGESITISCNYRRTDGEIKWCKLGSSCVTGLSGAIDGTSVTIDSRGLDVFHVSMSGLSTESIGWYFCVKGDLEMPVHVNVTEKPTTTTLATTISNTTGDKTKHSTSIDLKSLIITLSLLIVIVLVTSCVWFMLRKHKQNKPESSAITMAEADATYCNVKPKMKTSAKCEEEVLYSTVVFPSSDQRPCAETDVDVLYSSVVTIKDKRVKRAEAQDIDVSYFGSDRPKYLNGSVSVNHY